MKLKGYKYLKNLTVFLFFNLSANNALAACESNVICITQTTDAGNPSVVGSYSWAIQQANAGGNMTIGFDSAVFTGANPRLTLTGAGVQTPRLSVAATIDGSDIPNLTIDGSNQREILFIRPDAPDSANPIQVVVKGVTLANGKAQGGAGGGSSGGTFGAGVYRVMNYTGSLTNNGLTLGTPNADLRVQTSINNQVNLANMAGTSLNFWDGDAGPKNDGVIQGGNGTWLAGAANNNWTDQTGMINAG
ncbi:hypothetical protein, partial [Pseudochrobactrum asaccharolyticum]|uniref:hypothetical protein n=1 Tax=Pseudochrobactrum asaccharolyticum TaxID=354351 RepID=UPI001F317DD9